DHRRAALAERGDHARQVAQVVALAEVLARERVLDEALDPGADVLVDAGDERAREPRVARDPVDDLDVEEPVAEPLGGAPPDLRRAGPREARDREARPEGGLRAGAPDHGPPAHLLIGEPFHRARHALPPPPPP